MEISAVIKIEIINVVFNDLKMETETDTDELTLIVKRYDGDGEVNFRIRKNTIMSKLLNAYCDRNAINPLSVYLLDVNYNVIDSSSTATDYNLKNGDIIFVGGEFTKKIYNAPQPVTTQNFTSIDLNVRNYNGNDVLYRVRDTTFLFNILRSYCERMGLNIKDHIIIDNKYNILDISKSPSFYNMKNGDTLFVRSNDKHIF